MLYESRYNVLTNGEDGEHLLYNTASGSFAVLNDEALACLHAGGATDEALCAQLADAGFLTELAPDGELFAQREKFDGQRAGTDELTLVLAPTYACNYRCPYCYELGHNSIPGTMDDEVIQAVYDFIAERYDEQPFVQLSVQWYGGDPSLALGTVERMSAWMIAFCEKRDIVYSATILTNCNLIDEAAVRMLARNRVTSAFLTIDGLQDTHNARRVAADGSNSFERNVEAARLFRRHGITVNANMNADRVNWPEYGALRDYLRREADVELSFGRLCDYGHFYGTGAFAAPAFDLLDHDEFSRLKHDAFAAGGFDAAALAALLAPAPRFCNGQRDRYFVIDSIGDVYACDGWIGERDHVKFSIFDELGESQLHMLSHDPFDSPQCRACPILPLCWGNCDWERRCGQMECHPFLTTLPDYLRDWRSCFGSVDAPFTLLS